MSVDGPVTWSPAERVSTPSRRQRGRQTCALVTSLAWHGALWAMALSRAVTELPTTAGQREVFAVEARFSEEVSPAVEIGHAPEEQPIVVSPDRVQIAERQFISEPTDVEQPAPLEPRGERVSPPREPLPPTRAWAASTSLEASTTPRSTPPRRALRPAWEASIASLAATPQAVGLSRDLPEPVFNVPPTYPAEAARRRQSGRVVLSALVAEDGAVAEVNVAESSGHAVLDAAASRAVARWRFRPALDEGVARAMWLRVPVVFELSP